MKDWQRVEAVLFGSGKYLTEDQIAELSGVSKKSLKKALSDLKKHYEQIESSLNVFNENDSWKLNVKEEYSSIVKNVISEAEMPKAIMETLALIAYMSPVLQAEIIDRRGSGAYDHIGLLEERGFITKEKLGRTFKLRTSQKFFDYFDISGNKKLQEMFKGVKKPEKLGTLDVYNAAPEPEQTFDDKILERMKKLEENPVEHEERKIFLDNFDKKFEKAKAGIDEADGEMNEFRKVMPKEDSASSEGQQAVPDESDPDGVIKKFEDEIDKLDDAGEEDSGAEEPAEEEPEAPVKEEETEPELEEEEVPVKKKSSKSKKK
ncbi:MAG: SMC-Scp complex subunit ScpB [Candidatus Nanoarchaeia archaeon]